MRRVSSQHASRANVHAAGEGKLSIDNENLTVVAEICVAHSPWPQGATIPSDKNTSSSKLSDDRGKTISGAKVIYKHPDVDATVYGVSEYIDEFLSHLVGVENVCTQVDGFFCPLNRSHHGRIGLVTVLQDLHVMTRKPVDVGDLIYRPLQLSDSHFLSGMPGLRTS